MARFGLLVGVALVSMAQNPAQFAASQIGGQFAAASLPNPTINRVIICHGFACKFRTMIAFGPKDHAELRKIMAKVTSPETERAAIARAVAWYGKRIAPEAGTAGAKARSTASGDPSQIDCVEFLTEYDLRVAHAPRARPDAVSPRRALRVANAVGFGAFRAFDRSADRP